MTISISDSPYCIMLIVQCALRLDNIHITSIKHVTILPNLRIIIGIHAILRSYMALC